MSIPTSTVPAVKAHLLTQLKALPLMAEPVLVCYDGPGPYEPDDVIIVGDITSHVHAPGAMVGGGGQFWLQEIYTLQVIVDVLRGGDDPQGTSEQAWAFHAAICQLIRTDPSLGGLVEESRPGQTQTQSDWDDERHGRHVRLTLGVDVGAWL